MKNGICSLPVPCTVSPEEVTRVKGLGFLRDKTTPDKFNARVITRNGKITSTEAVAIARAAERFGSGEVAFTSRQTVEIQGVPFASIEPLRTALAEAGLQTGGTGPRVRPVVSCKGTTCVFGLIDTFGISEEIHRRFYLGYHDVTLPHKFKIAVGGCPNNCVKPDINDLGIVGARRPSHDAALCRACRACVIEKSCPMGAAALQDGKLTLNAAVCNDCGRCTAKCPFGVTGEATCGFRVYIGGRWGKKTARGIPLSPLFTELEEVYAVIERAILLFRDKGLRGERFADTVARLGLDTTEKLLLSDELSARKQEILNA